MDHVSVSRSGLSVILGRVVSHVVLSVPAIARFTNPLLFVCLRPVVLRQQARNEF